jgi:hypothetical protein
MDIVTAGLEVAHDEPGINLRILHEKHPEGLPIPASFSRFDFCGFHISHLI